MEIVSVFLTAKSAENMRIFMSCVQPETVRCVMERVKVLNK